MSWSFSMKRNIIIIAHKYVVKEERSIIALYTRTRQMPWRIVLPRRC